jgi:hypothetical protein
VKDGQKAKAPYDMTSEEIIGAKYLDEEKPENSYIVDGVLTLQRGPEKAFEVVFLYGDYAESNPLTDANYLAGKDGDFTFGEIDIPEFEEEELWNRQFNGWKLMDPDHYYYDDEEEVWIWNSYDLKEFDFEKNASKSVEDKLVWWNGRPVVLFTPSFTYLGAGTATLYSVNVEFDGLIHLMFKYSFCYYDRNADHYAVFRQGDTEIARVDLNDAEYAGPEGYDVPQENQRWTVTCPVPIVNYTDDINVTIETGDGEEWYTKTGKGAVIEGGYNYSLENYAETMATKGSSQAMRDLALSLQDYGIAARIYAGEDVGDLTISSAVTDLDVADMKDINELVSTPKDERPEGVKASVNVDFSYNNSLIVTYRVSGEGPYTFMLDDHVVNVAPDEDGKVVLRVDNIAPNELDDCHFFSCSDGTNDYDISTSVLGYAKRAAEVGSEDMQNLAKALYIYAKAAIAYVGTKK